MDGKSNGSAYKGDLKFPQSVNNYRSLS